VITSSPALSLEEYLQVGVERYTACLDSLEDTYELPGLRATAHFHHLKLDGNGRPRWNDLAKNLAYHILSYCFTVQRRQEARSDVEIMELRDEARAFFRDEQRAGEAGEMLLYFILEAVLRAPQMVAKISLKTNPAVETFGSDGIHMKWSDEESVLDLFFGEAKLYASFAKAATDAVVSIEKFHTNRMEEFELRMVTRHFKHAKGPLKDAILGYVKRGTASETVRINHACLLGYDWKAYGKLPSGRVAEMIAALQSEYRRDMKRIHDILDDRFSRFSNKELRFKIFVLPFTSVDEFRRAFLETL